MVQGRSAPTCPTEAGRATLFLSSRQAVPPSDMHVMDDIFATCELGTHFTELSLTVRHTGRPMDGFRGLGVLPERGVRSKV